MNKEIISNPWEEKVDIKKINEGFTKINYEQAITILKWIDVKQDKNWEVKIGNNIDNSLKELSNKIDYKELYELSKDKVIDKLKKDPSKYKEIKNSIWEENLKAIILDYMFPADGIKYVEIYKLYDKKVNKEKENYIKQWIQLSNENINKIELQTFKETMSSEFGNSKTDKDFLNNIYIWNVYASWKIAKKDFEKRKDIEDIRWQAEEIASKMWLKKSFYEKWIIGLIDDGIWSINKFDDTHKQLAKIWLYVWLTVLAFKFFKKMKGKFSWTTVWLSIFWWDLLYNYSTNWKHSLFWALWKVLTWWIDPSYVPFSSSSTLEQAKNNYNLSQSINWKSSEQLEIVENTINYPLFAATIFSGFTAKELNQCVHLGAGSDHSLSKFDKDKFKQITKTKKPNPMWALLENMDPKDINEILWKGLWIMWTDNEKGEETMDNIYENYSEKSKIADKVLLHFTDDYLNKLKIDGKSISLAIKNTLLKKVSANKSVLQGIVNKFLRWEITKNKMYSDLKNILNDSYYSMLFPSQVSKDHSENFSKNTKIQTSINQSQFVKQNKSSLNSSKNPSWTKTSNIDLL